MSHECVCGHVFANNTFRKGFIEMSECIAEYDRWITITERLGKEVATDYFSVPLELHTCETVQTIVFNNDGLDLCSERIVSKIKTYGVPRGLTRIFTKVMYGIMLLNNIGICHLDIRPENIVVDDELNAKIIDIGNGMAITDVIDFESSKGKEGPSYIFFPPMKFFLEDWMAAEWDIDDTTELLTEYMKKHSKMLYSICPTVYDRLNMITSYDSANPRSTMYKLQRNKEHLKLVRHIELTGWDTYSIGITLLIMLRHFPEIGLGLGVFAKLGFEMSHPDARQRKSLSHSLLVIEEQDL